MSLPHSVDTHEATSETNADAFEHQRKRSGNYDWNLISAGEGEKTCVLLHGTGASLRSWHGVMHALAPHYRVLAMDLPGHADTLCNQRPDLTLIGMASAVSTLLRDLQIQADVLVGHSAGAAIGAQMLIDEPGTAQRLISINGALMPLQGLPSYVFPPAARLSTRLPFLTGLFSSHISNPGTVDRLLKETGSHIREETRQHYRSLCQNTAHINGALEMMAGWRLEALHRKLHTLRVPVHLLAGSNDKMIPSRDAHQLASLIADSEVVVLPSLGHLAHEEQPDTIASLIRERADS